MPSITREQYDRWNAKATNGFSFDIKHYVCWGEKSLIKHIDLDGGKIAEFRISYMDEYKKETNKWGCSWRVPTGNKVPVLDVNVLHPSHTEGVYVVQHFKHDITLGDVEKKNNYGVLCKLAENVNVDEYINAMACA